MSDPLTNLLASLRQVLGSDAVRTGTAIGERALTDWTARTPTRPAALLLPRTTAEVSSALALCHAAHQAVVPQGGMTGLAGGAIARHGDIALSLERLSGIEEIDAAAATLTVRAGTTLQAAQEAAAAAGFELALDFGARGSCQIGGALATNAGGNRVIQSGTARDQTLGLEVVLADGTVLSSLNKMVKNNTGYDLKHLFIGSEGTLGIITRAVLRLGPRRAARHTALVALDDYAAAVALLRRLGARFGGDLSAFEIMWPDFFDFGVSLTASRRSPFADAHPMYALLELASFDAADDGERFAQAMADALDAGAIRDAILAQSLGEARALWAIREATRGLPRETRSGEFRRRPADRRDRRIRRRMPGPFRALLAGTGFAVLRPYRRFEPACDRRRAFGARCQPRGDRARTLCAARTVWRLDFGRTRHRHLEARLPADLAQSGRTRDHARDQARARSRGDPQSGQSAPGLSASRTRHALRGPASPRAEC